MSPRIRSLSLSDRSANLCPSALLMRVGLLLAALSVVAVTFYLDAGERARDMLLDSPLGLALLLVVTCYGLFALSMNVTRLVLVLRYKPVASPSDDRLPKITVLVPAYNEGELVAHTLHSLAASDYPPAKLELIAINDGSVDDTWLHIRRAADELAGRVVAVNCERNRGKRWALYEGCSRATGEIIVTVDSDSVVEPETLRNLVAPMVEDPTVGGVAGNVRVLNRDEHVLPRLLSVAFVVAFDFIRAAESQMGCVLCTPGALAAYRASVIRPMLDRWLAQTYFGRPATIGEDRAITNLILSQGCQVKFQSNSRVWTKVPTRFTGLRKMLTRWARSDIRESIVFARFGFTRFNNLPPWQRLLARLNFISRAGANLFGWPLLICLMVMAILHPATMGLKLLSGTLIGSLWSMSVCWFRGRRSDAIFAMVYSLFYLAALWWITPWGLFTSHRGGWLTRGPARRVGRRFRPLPALRRQWVGLRRTFRHALTRSPALTRLTSLLW